VPGCERRFVSERGLKAHQRAVHREEGEGFECDECGMEFGYRSVLLRHVETQHGEGEEGRKRPLSEKDKAFGRLAKRAKRQEEGEEDEEEEEEEEEALEVAIGARRMGDESEQTDGGESEGGRSGFLMPSGHGTAICVM